MQYKVDSGASCLQFTIFFQLSRPEKDRPYPTLPFNFCCDVTSFLFRYFLVLVLEYRDV